MTADVKNLIWIDLEMTGLEPETDRILEIATMVTDENLNVLAQGPVIAVHQSDDVLAGMDDWNQKHHGESGLIDRVRASEHSEQRAMEETLAFLREHVPAGKSPMCGNSVGQDRRFLNKYMRELEDHFHYRNLDVSTIKELVRRWQPELLDGFVKQNTHQALQDIKESIGEMRYYRETIFKI
ncbi:oligoribonuclease [Shewanella corallii]|uniref:Oligoribonuclease n=1 Tax=Shewanella corallii TaxID=560080 RepID=A0ABT0N7E5_9GAMM|nr:oligoribonuclease [Shewanella corallii]MCL2914383.1 oligoribonuclease [Shewanella corallii]